MIGASPPEVHWDAIDWQTIERQVLRLQMRIAKATREGRWGKVNALQWLLTISTPCAYASMRREQRQRQVAIRLLKCR
jgi:RNA-directed DNA polymerase